MQSNMETKTRHDLLDEIDMLNDKLLTVRTILRAIDYTRVPEEVTDCLMDAIKVCED